MDKRLAAFRQLLDIMDDLREKCPWDRKQTFESLRHLTIEETYELADAIIEGNLEEIRNELGDLLLHIVFYAKIGSEKKAFDITTVLESINKKLIRRHPHVYGEVQADNEQQVKENWEKIKLGEGKKRVLAGVPRTLPAMVKAYRIQDKARGVGFDWEHGDQVWEKVLEEMNELKAEVESGSDKRKVEEEFGDLFFALINYARFIDVNPESALERTNKKFIKRFEHLEDSANKRGQDIQKMNMREMDGFWNEAKSME